MKISGFISCMLITLALQFPLQGWAQKKQLTPIAMPTKFAFVDGLKLRKEYHAYVAAKDTVHKDAVVKRKAFEEQTHQLYQETEKQLKKDSIAGGHQRELITGNAKSKQSELENKYITESKVRTQARLALMKNYEDKIRAAIRIVMAEGAYTELRSMKDSSSLKGTNITDLVLAKLNQ